MASRTPGTPGGTSRGSSRGASGSGRGAGSGSSGRGSGSSGRGRGSSRVKVAPVKQGFPWGFAAGATALVVVLVAILFYAVANKGSGFQTAADKVDTTFSGIQVTKNPDANHVTTRVDYPGMASEAPDGGNHNPYPQTCAVYTAPVVNEHAVHSLEHGAVWITYRPGLPQDQVDVLAKLVEANTSYRMLSPYPDQDSPVAMQAWGRRLDVPSATDPRVARFVDAYTQGPQTREQGTQCSGVDQPGTVPFVLGPDGRSFVPGGATAEVPAEGSVPSGAAGSASPGSPATVPSGAPTSPAVAPSAAPSP